MTTHQYSVEFKIADSLFEAYEKCEEQYGPPSKNGKWQAIPSKITEGGWSIVFQDAEDAFIFGLTV